MFKIVSQALLALATLVAMATAASAGTAPPGPQDLMSYLNQPNVVRPGMGKDPGYPEGVPMTFPAGVRLAGAIMGAAREDGCGAAGDGGDFAVLVCVTVCNENDEDVYLTFPAGLTIVSKAVSQYQNGLLGREVTFLIPPTNCGEEEDIPLDADPVALERLGVTAPSGGFQVRLGLQCLNESMAPSEPAVPYALGMVVSDPAIRELLAMLKGLNLDEDDMQAIQTAIYSITEGRGLTPADRSALSSL